MTARPQIAVQVPDGWVMTSNQRHAHWSQRHRHAKWIRQLGDLAARASRIGPQPPSLLRLTIHRPHGGRLSDPDNLQPTWKPVIDGFVDAGIWPDDSHKYVEGPLARLAPTNLSAAGMYRLVFELHPMTQED